MRRLSLVVVVCAAATAPWSLAHTQTATQILAAGCANDAKKFCSGVQSGGGRIIACLKQNKDSLSEQCKQAAARASQMTAGGTPDAAAPTAPAAAPTRSTSAGDSADALVSAPTAASKPARTDAAMPGKKSATAGTGRSYLELRKVQLTGPGPDAAHPTVPAYDLLIPTAWKVDGGVKFGGSPSGCFADIYALGLRATSADGATVFAAGPDSSWQYADDPSVLQSLNDPTKRALGVGGKPCPVAKPMKAEDYIRQNILKMYPSGTTVVSVAPFPELNEIVRKRRGLPPGNGATGATRTEAVRVRLAYQKDGKDVEDWVAVGVVVNIYPAGRGSFYDSHATALVAFSAPKGKLDGNDQLFQVITSSIQPEPAWVKYTGGQLSKLYQAQAQKLATINAIWSDFYRKAAQTVNDETANMMKGSDESAFRADQNIRGVQTFRDPATGQTQELSNLYDHAWQNGANDYIMSNDSSFNPNEHVSGSWSQLQPVN
jgi:hypothetical protein